MHAKLLFLFLTLPLVAFGQINITQPGTGGGGSSYNLLIPKLVEIPAGLGWDTVHFPLNLSLIDYGFTPAYGVCDKTPEDIFNSVSTALTAPGVIYYVSKTGGNDTNDGLTLATAFANIGKAVAVANAGGVPAKIFVQRGVYARASTSITPTVDIAFVVTRDPAGFQSRAIVGTFEQVNLNTADATYTHTYSTTLANVARVMDMSQQDVKGCYVDMLNVATAAICDITPNSWSWEGGKLYVRRADHAPATTANTRIFRSTYNVVSMLAAPVNLYFGGEDPTCGFDFEGGSAVGTIDIKPNALPSSGRNAVVFRDCTFRYGGGISTDATRALMPTRSVSVDGLHGIAAFFNCSTAVPWSDGFNFHNSTGTSADVNVLLVNCSSWSSGKPGFNSSNNLTTHEDVKLIDLAGYYDTAHGGNVRCINSTKTLLAGTTSKYDFGDMVFNSSVAPSAVMIDDTGTGWLDRAHIIMHSGQRGVVTYTSGATIYTRNVWPTSASFGGSGTILPY